MPFAESLWGNLVQDLPLLVPVLFLWIVGTLMLWPLGSWLLKSMPKRQWSGITFVVLLVTLVLVFRTPAGQGFSGMFQVDGLTTGFQILAIVAAAITVILSQPQLNALKEQSVEYYALILFSTSGMMLLVGATDLVSLYMALELMALCIYILVGYLREQDRGIEAGIKYFLLGAFSSGLLVYGMSLIFAAAGGKTTNLAALNQALALAPRNAELMIFTGVILVLAGFGFKVAAVPFHMWSPDVYDGAPTPITAFLSTAPKAAALGAFVRLFGTAFNGVHGDWAAPLSFMAAASMILGNIAALRQQSMKRLLAYSSIAHVGYMLLAVLSHDAQAGAQAIWLYMLTYLLMQGGVFAVIIYLQGKGEGERIEDFRGLSKRRPMLAFAMLVFMLSLGGIPPMLGFFAKFYLFKLAIEQGFVTLTVLAFLTSAISAYYYLNVVATMYFKEAPEGEAQPMGSGLSIVVFATCLLVLVGTCLGPWLMDWTARIVLV
ncbi:NADH-quinone oxidoreductase subunit N [Holophaga foetida]|uniref:NADH-quinone oxidoreductase subunit N n=1 Tax=Holophaga foetida TaxID=35839 RepID=UPI000247262C|nr:NADH-quinone oxidoreductase subunit N [Holophaga foetida]